MRYQDHVVKQTQRALDDVLRAVEALPEDKRDWKPAETARSALNQLQEIAMSPRFFVPILLEGKMPEEIAEASAGNLLDVPWIEPEDVAHAVVFLASDKARYVTGSSFMIDAGLLTR